MGSFNSEETLIALLRNKGVYPGEPQLFSIHSYENNWGGTTFHSASTVGDEVDFRGSPNCHKQVLLWSRKRGVTEEGKAYLKKKKTERIAMSSYWIVGASWGGGTDPQDQKWVEQGIWMLGWKKGPQAEKAAEMKPGDRIAIKRMKGKEQTGIRIMHLGVIKGVILETNRVICTVDWVATNLNRDIGESRGCFRAIHGPFAHDAWIQEIFCL